MSLKKNLRKGQASLEYFILLALITSLVAISVSSGFLGKVMDSLVNGKGAKAPFYQKAVERILR